MTIENIENHMAYTCKCGGVNFALLKSGAIECNKCGIPLDDVKWWAGGMGAQLARAIKAEDERDALKAALPVGELTDEQIDAVLGAAYLKLVKETGYTGGMGGETWDKTAARAILASARSQPTPDADDLYWKLHSLSASMEGSGLIDEHDNPEAYGTLLDAMNALRARSQPVREPLSLEELELCRQWFNSVQDTNGGFLEPTDYVLAEKLYGILKIRVPSSITSVTNGITKKGEQ